MASRRESRYSSTPSEEGEIVELGSESKAPVSNRLPSGGIERSRGHGNLKFSQPQSRDIRSLAQATKVRSRSRSRSPYRHDKGHKRRRYEEHEEYEGRHPERYESQYNDRQHGRDTLRRSRGYHDYDRSESYGSGLPYNDDEYDHHKQNRQRSFSPYRARKPKQYEDSGRSNEFVPKQEMNEAKTPNSPVSKEPASHQVKVADKPNDQSTSEVVGQTEQEPLDEEAIREERRRKRAAIRAKYQAGSEAKSPAETEVKSRAETEAGVLHLKALQVGPEVEASTPGTNAGSTRETTDSPQITPGKAGLSAADYDPVLDTKEDRSKHGITPTTTQDVSSAASDETKPATQDTSAPNAPHRAPKKDAFDMFALDDDVDMFGEGPESIAPEAGRELAASMMDDWNDSEGYYKIQLGELIKQQYVVKETIGKGVFSTVVRAYDKKAQNMVAIKIVRQNESMRKTGFREIGILGKLRKADPDDKHHLIMYKQHFDHKGHLCMVFENLSMDLRTVIRKYGLTSGLKLDDVRKYGRQMFVALKLLRACEIVHADIKPDNLLVNETRDFLKLCDLGSAAPIEEDEVAPYLVSRFYRAPEVILGCKRDYAVDVWSVGCTLYELLTGEILFTGRNNNQMLRVIMECRGKIPPRVVRRGECSPLHYDQHLVFASHEINETTGRPVIRNPDFKRPIQDLKSRVWAKKQPRRLANEEAKMLAHFVDLLDRCLCLSPEKRITPASALDHPFFAQAK